MGVDYEQARERIIAAFCGGLLSRYGSQRVEVEEREVEQPGRPYWDKSEVWTDPKGITRKGRFKRLPSTKVRQKVEVPKGIPEGPLTEYAEGMADAFLEVIRIIEEAR